MRVWPTTTPPKFIGTGFISMNIPGSVLLTASASNCKVGKPLVAGFVVSVTVAERVPLGPAAGRNEKPTKQVPPAGTVKGIEVPEQFPVTA